MRPTAYEGSDPYIFISYAHKDTDRVFEIVRELDRQGCRYWYDEGIAPGSEWPEDVARHLYNAAMLMAFISPNSMQSENCRREINFALSKHKPFVSIVLEKTDMPLGMEMQLSNHQSILRYNFTTWEAFIHKVLQCPNLAPCLGETEEAPVASRAPVMSDGGREARLVEVLVQTADLHKKGEFNKEASLLLANQELGAGSADYMLKLGRAYRMMGNTQKAMECYKKVQEIDPNNPVIYSNIAIAYTTEGHYDTAKPYFERCLSMIEAAPLSITQSDLASVYGNYALCIGLMGDMKGAKEYLRRARDQGYPDTSVNYVCDRLHITLKSLDHKSLVDAEEVRVSSETPVMSDREREARLMEVFVQAADLSDKEEYAKELNLLLANQELGAGSADYMLKLGRAYRRTGNTPKAMGCYEKARELNPNNPVIYSNMAIAYTAEGQYDTAKPYFEKCLSMVEAAPLSITKSSLAAVYGSYALCIGLMGDMKGAKEYLKLARDQGYPDTSIDYICDLLHITPKSVFGFER